MKLIQELKGEDEKLIMKFMLANRKEDFIGSIVLFAFSKQIFLRNVDIDPYIREVLGLEFKPYVFRSRTLLVAKICKVIFGLDDVSFREAKRKNKSYLKVTLDKALSNKNRNSNSKKSEDNLDNWINAILNK